MARKEPRVNNVDEKDKGVQVGHPKDWAAGLPGVYHSLKPAVQQMGVKRTLEATAKMNQKDGFDCPSCAWPDPGHRSPFEYCEEGIKAVTWERSEERRVGKECRSRWSPYH